MNLKEQREAALKEARAICEQVKAAGRSFTEDERVRVETLTAKADRLGEQIKGADATEELMRRIAATGDPAMGVHGERAEEAKAALMEVVRHRKAGSIRVPRSMLSGVKAATADHGSPAPLTVWSPGAVSVPVSTSVVSLRSLFPVEQVDSPVVRYYRVSAPTGGPDITAEGALKPDILNDVTPVDGTVVKIAGKFRITMELDRDVPSVVEELLAQAGRALITRENMLTLTTMAGTSGIATATGLKTAALETIATAVGGQEALNGVTPAVIVMNPADLAMIRVQKSSGSGEFVLDPLSAAPANIFGIPVLSTPSLASGTVWLASGAAGKFYERDAPQITTGLSGDDMDYNKLTVVIEERVLPVIYQPSMLTKITLTTS